MSKDNNILPASVIASLYKNNLVLPSAPSPAPMLEKNNAEEVANFTGPIKYLGEQLKKIMVIVEDTNAVHLNESDFVLLTSILNACKLTIADIALINIANQKTSLHQMLSELPSTLVICFAVDAAALKIKLPSTLYKVTQVGDTHLLFSNALSSMQGTSVEAKQEKAKLWTILKKIFEL